MPVLRAAQWAVQKCAGNAGCRAIVARGAQQARRAADRVFRGERSESQQPSTPSKPRSRADDVGDPGAQGHPHSVPKGRGGRDGYTTYGPVDPKTGKPESVLEYRPEGKPHGDIPRPNVKERLPNTAPDGTRRPGKPVVRPPKEEEIPR